MVSGLGPAEAVDELLDLLERRPVQAVEVGLHIHNQLDAIPDVLEVDVECCTVLSAKALEESRLLPGFGLRRGAALGGGR